MQKATSVNSLTSDFQKQASPEDKRERREVKDEANRRNQANRRALGQWHNDSRGKNQEVPMPRRRTT